MRAAVPGEQIFDALRHVWRTLAPLNVPMAIIGGLALATWKHVLAKVRTAHFIVPRSLLFRDA